MRCCFIILLVLEIAASSFGQPALPKTTGELAVLKYSWTRERVNWDHAEEIVPRGIPSRVSKEKDNAPIEYQRKEASDQRSVRMKSVETKQPIEDPNVRYTYTVTVRNDSSKKIVEIDWDYVFFDTTTQEEIGRRQFTSEDKIEPGKTKKLTAQVPSPPTHRVDVNQSGKNEKAALTENVVILRILYQDKSEWKAAVPN